MPKLIRNTYAGWVSSNPVLALEDTGFERDTGRSKVGDGVKAWNELNYFNEGGGSGGGGSAALPYIFLDDYSTDRIASDYDPAFGTVPVVSNGQLRSSVVSAEQAVVVKRNLLVPRAVACTAKIVTGVVTAATSYIDVILAYIDPNNYIFVRYQLEVRNLVIYQRAGGAYAVLGSAAMGIEAALGSGVQRWVHAARSWNKVYGAVYSADPHTGVAPIASRSATHNVSDGHSLLAAIPEPRYGFAIYAPNATTFGVDEFRVDR